MRVHSAELLASDFLNARYAKVCEIHRYNSNVNGRSMMSNAMVRWWVSYHRKYDQGYQIGDFIILGDIYGEKVISKRNHREVSKIDTSKNFREAMSWTSQTKVKRAQKRVRPKSESAFALIALSARVSVQGTVLESCFWNIEPLCLLEPYEGAWLKDIWDRGAHHVCCPRCPPIDAFIWSGAAHEETGLQRNGTSSFLVTNPDSISAVMTIVFASGERNASILRLLYNDTSLPQLVDNARPHTARVSQDCLRMVTTLLWPARSPDLSPIEHIWNHL
ncbi:transposable element Tcb2 transposase [Trichonephila clavipes]|nr:transposable element Tcb2 transposase [Trichonephila clavipes]